MGIPLGTYIIAHVSPSLLRVLIAATVVGFSIPLLLGYSLSFNVSLFRRLAVLLVLASGVSAMITEFI